MRRILRCASMAGAFVAVAMVWLSPLQASTKADASLAGREEVRRIVIQEAMRSRSVPPALALAVAEVESDFRADAESSAGALGVMQMMPRTASGEFGVQASELWEPRLNIQLGIAFLDDLIDRYNGRVDLALSHYNGGSAVRKAGVDRIIPATRSYVQRVLKLYRRNRASGDVRAEVVAQGRVNPSLRLVRVSAENSTGNRTNAQDWRHYLDLASRALGEPETRSTRGARSAEALIRLIEETKARFRDRLRARAG